MKQRIPKKDMVRLEKTFTQLQKTIQSERTAMKELLDAIETIALAISKALMEMRRDKWG